MSLRFAPSPTGKVHIGGIRTLIINYIFSILEKQPFIIRIDDTDTKRNKSDSIENIFSIIGIMGIKYDKIKYQSSYIYKCQEYANKMLEKKIAYMCICQVYNESCECRNHNYKNGRIIIIGNGEITFEDTTYGKMTLNKCPDIVISRSNGEFLYNFISAVCDIEDKTTHIIRGSDHIDNTHLQMHIMQSIKPNMEKIQITHLPMIINSEKEKISKRDQNDIDIINMIKSGYLIESIIYYCATMGSNKQDDIITNIEQLIESFKTVKFSKRNIEYDVSKLNHINKKIMKKMEQSDMMKNISLIQMYNTKKIGNIYVKNIINRSKNIIDYINIIYMTQDQYIPDYDKNIYQENKKIVDELYESNSCKQKINLKLNDLKNNKEELIKFHKIIRKLIFNVDSFIGTSEFLEIMNDQTIKNRINIIKHL